MAAGTTIVSSFQPCLSSRTENACSIVYVPRFIDNGVAEGARCGGSFPLD